MSMRPVSVVFAISLLCSCPKPEAPVPWQQVYQKLPSALLSVWGTSASDVWTVEEGHPSRGRVRLGQLRPADEPRPEVIVKPQHQAHHHPEEEQAADEEQHRNVAKPDRRVWRAGFSRL